ncbi:BREX-1 system adenine-specific DNA-methyltransferase PglX [Aliarcobacter cryaerophilus]|uniref:BREX-1 system adenine-specific DNA-methyltransferase PglX n=1 Tax=Aliarcobacter cryaerophilus TaxID=28198 RepID=UPI00112F2124|nr:BREX-1 system adenine-specific DNA-methyltransferase PglX [Aliarcobacter cryaerophilus]
MATYIRVTDYKDSDSKEQGFFKSENRYEANQSDFKKIPGSPIAYWVSDRVKDIFEKSANLETISEFKTGMSTGDNEKFQRIWYEVFYENINFIVKDTKETRSLYEKWFPCKSGGEYHKWYGNNEMVVNWQKDGQEIRNFKDEKGKLRSRPQNSQYFFKKSLTWSKITSYKLSLRYNDFGYTFDAVGLSAFIDDDNIYYVQAFLNSNLSYFFTSMINQSMHIVINDMNKLPIIFPKQESIKQAIDTLTQENINISKEEWDSRETSWDFSKNELLKHKSDSKLESAYNNYCSYWKEKFYKLHANEEELNRLFIDIYELQDELTPDVALKDITILKSESIINEDKNIEFKADEIMKQFISYAVGVMFGRYSIDSDGLVVANLNQDYPKDTTFEIDDDNVIPVLEDDYFSDDIASRIINFVKTTFGSESLSENINFIEKCLGKTVRAYMVKDFYEDHIKRYKKRPIYWMVSSPKKGFMSLSYMHRYTNDLFARVQNNYLREYITKLEGTKDILRQIIVDESASSKDKKDADKKIKDIENKLKELISFDRDVLTSYAQNRVDIDLDDGVKVNYNKFKEVLYPIKGLDKE